MTKNGGTGRYFRWQMGNGENKKNLCGGECEVHKCHMLAFSQTSSCPSSLYSAFLTSTLHSTN